MAARAPTLPESPYVPGELLEQMFSWQALGRSQGRCNIDPAAYPSAVQAAPRLPQAAADHSRTQTHTGRQGAANAGTVEGAEPGGSAAGPSSSGDREQQSASDTDAAAGPGTPRRVELSSGSPDRATAPAAARRAASLSPTEPHDQFADDLYSPYAPLVTIEVADVLKDLWSILIHIVAYQYCRQDDDVVLLPPPPSTAKAAAELQSQIDTLLQAGCLYEALPWLCQVAMYCIWATRVGPEHPDTLQAMYSIVGIMFQYNRCSLVNHVYAYMLPRAAKHWGLGHAQTRQLVEWGAYVTADMKDPKIYVYFHRVVYNVARHLPGGLGWGTAAVTLVPDEEAYRKHVALQERAEGLGGSQNADERQLAVQMLRRCLAYYESVGPHWLCSPRKYRVKRLLWHKEPAEKRVQAIAAIRREAIKELGPQHRMTMELTLNYGEALQYRGEHEKAMSMFQQALRGLKATLGPCHQIVFGLQVCMAHAFAQRGRAEEALALSQDTFETAWRALGPDDTYVTDTLIAYYDVLKDLGRKIQVKKLLQRAASLGVDTSMCTHEHYMAWKEVSEGKSYTARSIMRSGLMGHLAGLGDAAARS